MTTTQSVGDVARKYLEQDRSIKFMSDFDALVRLITAERAAAEKRGMEEFARHLGAGTVRVIQQKEPQP